MKVLIVDENPADLLMQTDLLALKGFTVMHARSAVDGMKYITTENPDLVIADVMPYDTTYEDRNAMLRAMVAIYDLPMIAVSYGVKPNRTSGTQRLGCIGLIAKPINTRTYADDVLKLWESRIAAQGG